MSRFYKKGVWIVLLLIILLNVVGTVRAEEKEVDLSVDATAGYVDDVKSLAGSLAGKANFLSKTGGFPWETETGKNRSWTYYNGIMMDAFLMMEEHLEQSYTEKVKQFYLANIADNIGDKGEAYGYVNYSGASNNYYRYEELDSIPPTRALFDLIKNSNTNQDKYVKMIQYVYGVMKNYTKIDNSIFVHKYSWTDYKVGLDGLYMAQPFFMELANAIDDPAIPLTSSMFNTTSGALYDSVITSMEWVHNNLYDENKKLYNHGWSAGTGAVPQGVNGHYWLRGIGWYAAALADVITMLPEGYETQKQELLDIATELFDGMIDGTKQDGTTYQDEATGMWYNVVDRERFYSSTHGRYNELESSGSALMAYAMMKLYDQAGINEKYGIAGLKAFNGTVKKCLPNGEFLDVYKQSGVEGSDEGYLKYAYVKNEAKGVGPLMMAACYANDVAAKLQKADPEITDLEANTLTYDGTEQELVTFGSVTGGTLYYALGEDNITPSTDDDFSSGENTDPTSDGNTDSLWTLTIPTGTDAGTYYVWYKVIGDEGYNDVDPTCIPVTISKRALTITADSAEKDYTGEALTKNSFKSEGLAETDEIVSVTITGSRTDVGESNNVPSSAEIKRKTEETDPSTSQGTTGTPESSDVSENYDITYVNGKLKVTKASNTVTVSIEGWTYGDTAKTPTVTASFGTPVISYSKDQNGTFTSAVPTNAGTWYVKAEVAGTSNYDDATTTTSFTIAKKPASIKAVDKSKTYGVVDPGLTATVEGTVNGESLNYTLSRTAGENVGEYDITVTVGDNPNYDVVIEAAKLNIEAKEIGLTWTDTSFTYDGNNHLPTATATNLVGEDACNVTVEGEQKNAGTHTATATGLSNNNYKLPSNATQSFTIEKAVASYTSPEAKTNLVYSGQAQALIEQGSTKDGTMQYALGDKNGTEPKSGWASDIPTAINAETYNVWYKVAGDGNHTDTDPAYIRVTISKAAIKASAAGYTGTYDGNFHSITVTVTEPANGATISYSTTTETDYTLDTVPSFKDAGTHTVYYQITANNYETSAGSTAVEISKKDLTIIAEEKSKVYGTEDPALTYTQEGLIEGDSITGALNRADGEAVGEYDIIQGTLTAGDNYSIAYTPATLTITAAASSVSKVPEAETLTYTGEAQALITAGEAAGGVLQYAVTAENTAPDASLYTTSIPSETNAGTYYVWYKVIGDDGYKDTEPASIEVTIGAAVILKLNVTKQLSNWSDTMSFEFTLTSIDGAQMPESGGETAMAVKENPAAEFGEILYREAGVYKYTITETDGDVPGIIYDTSSHNVEVTVMNDDGAPGKLTATARYDDMDSLIITNYNAEKETAVVVNAPAAKTLYYTGSAQALVTMGEAEGGTIVYALGNENGPAGEYTTSIPTATNAGTYYVWYKVTGDDNHNDTEAASVSVEIKKADNPAPAAPEAESATVNTITLKASEGYQYSMDRETWQDSNVFTGLSANTAYSFYQRIKEDDNHNASPASPVASLNTNSHVHDWTYSSDGAVITATCQNKDEGHVGANSATLTINAPAHVAYGDKESPAATLTGSIEGIQVPDVVYRNGNVTLDSAPTAAGTSYTASISLGEATAAVNYAIAPKKVKITGLSVEDKPYDGTVTATIIGTPQLVTDKPSGLFGFFGSAQVSGGAVEEGDTVYVDYGTASFETPEAENNKTVIFTGFSLSGASAYNYDLTGQPENARADITKRKLTIKSNDQTIKEGESIDGNSYQITEGTLVDGHSLSSVALRANGSLIVPSGAVITDASGTDVAGNYDITYQNCLLTVIYKRNYTVTFKVVNGFWNDETEGDKTLPLSGYENEMLTLPADQIPSAGGNPAAGYQAGSWDVTPSAGTVITGDTTYTYTYAKQPETITITYDTNGGEGSYGPSTADANGSVTLPGAPSREGYTFAGWKLDGVTYQPGQTITVSKSGTATAVWTPVSQASSPSDLIPDNTLTVKGLQQGDIVYFYKVLEFNADANGSDNGVIGAGGWAVNEKFASILTTVEDVESVLGLCVDAKGIDHNLAGRLGSCAVNTPELQATANADGIAKVETGVTPGLWIGIVKPANPGIIYNPVFLGADYDTDNDSNVLVIPIEKSYSDNAMVKVDKITLTKTAKDAVSVDDNDKETVAVGDIITFTIATQIPAYASNYTKPVFMITDKLSSGLTFDKSSSVAVFTGENNSLSSDNYSLSVNEDGSGFTLSFTDQYLKNIIGATTAVKLEYKATVTSSAVSSVNPEDNTVTLNYSTEPSDQEGHGILKDRTNHYTFDIDANLFGEDSYGATEVVKVGVDAQGNEIKESRQLSNGSWVGALQGAKFRLYKNDGTTPYTNKYITANTVFISDVDGRLKQMDGQTVTEYGIRGLDAGEYKLVETQAPAGYVKLQDAVSIKIEAKTREVTYEDDGTLYKADELESYTVKIGGKETANYTMTNTAINTSHVDPAEDPKPNKGDKVGQYGFIKGDEIGTSAADGKLINTQGAELPSTGGSGVTLFYAIGLIMTMCSGCMLMRKRRAA